MKNAVLLFCSFCLLVVTVAGSISDTCAQTIRPRALFDINAMPAVATDSNNNFTFAWSYMGLGHLPGILAKRYDSSGQALDSTGFWVNSGFGSTALFNYDPDMVIDSTNNAVIAWCALGLLSSENAQVVYTRVSPHLAAAASATSPAPLSAITPQQDDDPQEILSIPYSPAIAIHSDDTIAIVWSYFTVGTNESGIYLTVVKPDGTAGTPVKVASNIETLECGATCINPVLYFSPSVAFDMEGKILITWTAAGLQSYFLDTELPFCAVYYSKYDSSGKVVSDYDKLVVGIGFNSRVAVNNSNTMLIAWNAIDLFTFKVRIMAALSAPTAAPSSAPLQMEMGEGYTPSAFVDAGNYLFNTGIDIAPDSAGNFFITWGGSTLFNDNIYLKAIYSGGSSLSEEIKVSQGSDFNNSPSLAIDSADNIIVAWNKVSLANLLSGSGSVYARRYDNTLQALGDEFKINLSY
jgi:hypothetical protein